MVVAWNDKPKAQWFIGQQSTNFYQTNYSFYLIQRIDTNKVDPVPIADQICFLIEQPVSRLSDIVFIKNK
jgi:hypothetical protein